MLRLYAWLTCVLCIPILSQAFAATTPLRTQQETLHPTVYEDGGHPNHVYGYAFTPSTDGTIVGVSGRFSGSREIVLIDNTDYQVLGSATVAGTPNVWTDSPLSGAAVTVIGGHSYSVLTRMGASNSGRAIWGIALPFSQSDVHVTHAMQGWSADVDVNSWVVTARAIQGNNLKGLVDVLFVADEVSGDCQSSGDANLQSLTAAESGCTAHESIDASALTRNDNPDKPQYWADFPGVKGTLSAACEQLHDRYWTTGPDGDVYATWHPAARFHPDTGEGCVFGHEHGEDPSTSPVFGYSGGWPPFGYVVKTRSSARVEDHFGHKVTVATFRAGLGNHPQDGGNDSTGENSKAIHDAGFDCHWLSKLHQGSWSLDAFSNHLHEYFLTVSCDGEPLDSTHLDDYKATTRTRFSIKALVPFGEPNKFSACQAGTTVGIGSIKDQNNRDLPAAQATTPIVENSDQINQREFFCFNTADTSKFGRPLDALNQYDLWTQPYSIEGPNDLSLHFQAYYIVKNPARSLNASATRVAWMTDLCEQNQELGFCAQYQQNKSAAGIASALQWHDPLSPFQGALRAVNFKRLAIYQNRIDDPASFCTNTQGKSAQPLSAGELQCPAGMIKQTVAKDFESDPPQSASAGYNLWNRFDISGSLYVYGQTMKYRKKELSGNENPLQPNDYLYTGSDSTGLAPLNTSGFCPANGSYTEVDPARLGNPPNPGFCPLGIGFEKIVDMRDVVRSQHAAEAAAVRINPETGKSFNTGLHAPN